MFRRVLLGWHVSHVVISDNFETLTKDKISVERDNTKGLRYYGLISLDQALVH